MSDRDSEWGYLPRQKGERSPVRTKSLALGLALGAAALLFATTFRGRALLHVEGDQAAMLRSLGGASICAFLVVLSLWRRERDGTDTRQHRRFLPFILLGVTVASLLAFASIAFG